MSGYLPKKAENFSRIEGANIAIIASSWHSEIVSQMISTSQELIEKLGANLISSSILPGSLELPLAAKLLFAKNKNENKNIDAIIAFGVILKGDTSHNETVEREVANGFTLVSQEFSKPVINEVIGVSDIEFAKDRASSKGVEAVYALSEFLNWQRSLG